MIFPMKKVMFHMFPVDLCAFSHSSNFGIVTWLMRTKRDEKGTFAKSFPETWRKHVKGKSASQSTFLFGKASLNQVPELTRVRSHLVHLVVKGAGQIQINSHMWSPQSHANKSKCLYIYIYTCIYLYMYIIICRGWVSITMTNPILPLWMSELNPSIGVSLDKVHWPNE